MQRSNIQWTAQKAEAFPRDEVSKRIETAAREALQNLANAKVPGWHGPYRFALTFQDETRARLASLVPGAERYGNGLIVQARASDFEEGYRLSTRLIGLASFSGRSDARQAVLAALPNAAHLQVNTVDWLYDRFLERLPSASSTGQKQHCWGAH